MNTTLLSSASLVLLALPASAQMSASGAGSAIPATGTGGGGTWDTVQPASSTPSVANVPVAVTGINSIVLEGLTHTFIGDLQLTLADPNGVQHNVFLRPGMDNGNQFGQAGDMLLGDWTFVPCGGMDLPDCGFTVCGNADVPFGTYNQTFFTGANLWTDGNSGIFNTDMCSITGPAGDWTLQFYDWAVGDSGSFTGWTMNFNGPACGVGCDPGGPFAESCNGDGGDQMGCSDCPCGNDAPQGTVGGCLNSAGTSSRLLASGSNSIALADLRFEASGVAPSNSCVLTSGNALAPAQMANPCFGLNSGIQSVSLDGLRCAVQGVLRHGVRPSDANGDVGVTTNGWGTPNGFFQFDVFVAGNTKHFQIIHRDDSAQVCQTGQNTSQAVSVTFTM